VQSRSTSKCKPASQSRHRGTLLHPSPDNTRTCTLGPLQCPCQLGCRWLSNIEIKTAVAMSPWTTAASMVIEDLLEDVSACQTDLIYLDWVLSDLDEEMSISLEDGLRLNHLAFADDVALVTSTKQGTKRLARQIEVGLAKVGLLPNGKKSATLSILVDGKTKRWVCDNREFLTLNSNTVPVLRIQDVYRYLGTSAGCRTSGQSVRGRLTRGLREIRWAPLKPQQRMFILRVHLIPGLYHQLVLDNVTKGLLQDMDRMVRQSIRDWCHLPHDVPLSMFYARAADGGYGLPCLSAKVPIMRRNRIQRLQDRAEKGDDPVLKWMVDHSPTLDKEIGNY